jgi:hypothetical protein
MFFLISMALASNFFLDGEKRQRTSTSQEFQGKNVCCADFHANPVESLDHGRFHFSPLAVGFMERKKFDIQRIRSLEKEIMEHPGKQSILSNDGFYIAVVGLQGQKIHPGCFENDDQCRVLNLLELTRK